MALPALIPLVASALPAITSLFSGGSKDGGGKGAAAAADHPVKGGTDLPPILAATLQQPKSGHVLPGQRGVLAPPLETALERVHAKQQSEPILRHQEKAARAAVNRVNAQVAPQLQQLAKGMRDRAVQIQATAEHKAIVERDARYRRQAQKMDQIIQKLDRLSRQMGTRWHV